MLRVRILLIQPWIVFFLKNWRHLNFYEHFIKKFHIKKVKCLVKWLGWRAVASGLYECVRILITVRDYRLGFLEPASKYRSAVHVLRWSNKMADRMADQLSLDDVREFLISLSNTIGRTVTVYNASDLVGLEICERRFDEHTRQGCSQHFSKGGSQRLLTGLSCRIIAAWRPILTKDKSRWRKYFTKKQILKK